MFSDTTGSLPSSQTASKPFAMSKPPVRSVVLIRTLWSRSALNTVHHRSPRWLAAGALGVCGLTLTSGALAATYYVGPEGAGTTCTRTEPCALSTGAELAMAGDTVILLDGTYNEPLNPENSGTPDAWITFQADECALPIIEGPGEGILEYPSGEAPSGVASNSGTYLRFVGLVSRYWDSGFTNGWTGQGTTNSNGHFEYINCIGDGNGRTGMVLYSAPSVTIRECISTHNGGNPTGSWSSGIQLYAVQGTADDNIIERNVSFENTDAEKNSDGSGFIVDEDTRGATFINNLAFRNGGSCMRLTRSDNTRMINFTCYHNGLNPAAYSPTNPGEFYFTDSQSRSTGFVINSLAAASGSVADPAAFLFPPEGGLANNYTVDSGATPFYTDPEGTNPDFRPPASAAGMVENQGNASYAPYVDLGFDPKCIVRRNPNVPFQQSWWTHSVDYDYIRSIGGVAQCFRPKQRVGGVDIGAYELSGEPHVWATPGSCVPIVEEEMPQDPAPEEPVTPEDPPVDDPPVDNPPVDEPVVDEGTMTDVMPIDEGMVTDVAPESSDPAVTPAPVSSTDPAVTPTPAAPTTTPTAPAGAEMPVMDGVMNGVMNGVAPGNPIGIMPSGQVAGASSGQGTGAPAPGATTQPMAGAGGGGSSSGCRLSAGGDAARQDRSVLAGLGLLAFAWLRRRARVRPLDAL